MEYEEQGEYSIKPQDIIDLYNEDPNDLDPVNLAITLFEETDDSEYILAAAQWPGFDEDKYNELSGKASDIDSSITMTKEDSEKISLYKQYIDILNQHREVLIQALTAKKDQLETNQRKTLSKNSDRLVITDLIKMAKKVKACNS